MKPVRCGALVAALVLCLAAGRAQAIDARDLERCARIDQPEQRLACYDAVVPQP